MSNNMVYYSRFGGLSPEPERRTRRAKPRHKPGQKGKNVMTLDGFFITRDEIKARISAEWKLRNFWQAKYVGLCNAPNEKGADMGIDAAAVTKARAIRSEHRARALSDALSLWCDIQIEPIADYETPRVPDGYHPITKLEIEWKPGDTETIEISG